MMTSLLTDDEETVRLALAIQRLCSGHGAAPVIYASCWVLAGIILQAERERRVTSDQSIAMIAEQLTLCVEHLDHVAPKVH